MPFAHFQQKFMCTSNELPQGKLQVGVWYFTQTKTFLFQEENLPIMIAEDPNEREIASARFLSYIHI